MNDPDRPELDKHYSGSSAYLAAGPGLASPPLDRRMLPTQPFLPYAPPSSEKDAVKLAPWGRQWLPLAGLVVAVILQAILFGGSCYIWRNPVVLPVGQHIHGSITSKDFNLIVSLTGAVVGGVAAFGVAVGARSYLSRRLVGDGVSLLTYDSLWAVSNVALGRRISKVAAVPIFLYILSNMASSAVVAIWTVGNSKITTTFSLPYIDIQSNLAHFDKIQDGTLGAQLLQPQDFEGIGPAAAQLVVFKKELTDISMLVDGLNYTLGGGLVPSLLQISTLRNSLEASGTSVAVGLDERRLEIITKATTNRFTLSAPTIQVTSSCISLQVASTSSPVQARIVSTDSQFVVADITDSNCPSVSVTTQIPQGLAYTSGAISCMQGEQAYISYYSFDTRPAGSTQNDVFNPLAACFVKAQTGVGENIQYFDVNSTYALPDASHAAPFRFDPATVIDATKYASALVGEWWIFYAQKSSGSASLSYFIRVVYSGFFGKADLSSTSIAANFEAYTRALYSMALLKMLNTENFYHRDPAWVAISNGTFGGTADVPVFANYATSVVSDALVIGPTGFTALILLVVGAMLAVLCTCLALAIKFAPVSLNPLDPVSVLLVAQNSAPSMSVDGGCTGDLDQIRSKSDKLHYRAVNPSHLAFVFGPSYLDPPKFGQMYGSLSERTEDAER